LLVPTPLHKTIQYSTILIDSPPQVVPRAVDRQKHLIQVPLVPWSGTTASQLVGIALTEFTPPFPDGFIRHNHPAGEQEFFDIAVAQAETELKLDAVADNLGWKAMVVRAVSRWYVHATSMAHQVGARQVRSTS
jgi:hypothetical protein